MQISPNHLTASSFETRDLNVSIGKIRKNNYDDAIERLGRRNSNFVLVLIVSFLGKQISIGYHGERASGAKRIIDNLLRQHEVKTSNSKNNEEKFEKINRNELSLKS